MPAMTVTRSCATLPIMLDSEASTLSAFSKKKILPANSPILFGVKILMITPQSTDFSERKKETCSKGLINIFHFTASIDQLQIIRRNTIRKVAASTLVITSPRSTVLCASFIFFQIYRNEKIKIIAFIKRLITL